MKQICQVHGLTLREFARIFEMSKSHAEDIWNQVRFPSLPEAIQIARYFEVTVEELFGWRLDDKGDRRPLLVEDPRTGKVVRLNRNNELQSALALVRARQRHEQQA